MVVVVEAPPRSLYILSLCGKTSGVYETGGVPLGLGRAQRAMGRLLGGVDYIF